MVKMQKSLGAEKD